MSRHLRIAGLFLASLTIVTVALAQQSGSQGRGDMAPRATAIAAMDEGKPRLSRANEPRRARTDCPAETCDTPPKPARSAQAEGSVQGGCGNDGTSARDRNGKVIRRICQVF
ncbi:hypothetical protein [Bosea sp. 124]|uniref:hypothetical protein n=1 Tax=Bosea sp. 124 TaxID=2135642 RepID=UPI000D3CF5C8|nr:hypothetical protein [Bosea sp. 124]PTM42921.1 hypothetical protein C8D03_4522 [Bosea sp. 124]